MEEPLGAKYMGAAWNSVPSPSKPTCQHLDAFTNPEALETPHLLGVFMEASLQRHD